MADVSVALRPPCWCPSGWAPAWRLHTNLYKFGYKVSPHILHKKNCCDLNLGENLCIFTFSLFSDSGLYLLGGEQGWRSGESAHPTPMCPGFDSRTRRHMWAEFVGSLLCSERFFSGNSGFPLSSKTNI